MFLQTNSFSILHRGRSLSQFAGLFALALLAFVSSTAAQTGSSIPVPYDPTVKRMGVAIVSTSTDLETLLQNAFKIHGAFDLVTTPGAAQYTLHADLVAAGRVTIAVESKAFGVAPFTTTGTGANWYEAAYRAADAVVEKLTSNPGFFAGRLAFVSTRAKAQQIFTSDLLGKDVRGWASGSLSYHPRWSPDGSKLLYTSNYSSGFPDLILLNMATHVPAPIANFKGTNTGGVFSPDGRSIAMILSYTGTPQLYVSDADGKNRRALTRDASLKFSPTWSPDGKHIILGDDSRYGTPLLYQISAAGGTLQPLNTGILRYSGDAVWNPRDPDLVAFIEEQGSQYFIAVYSFKTQSSEIYDAVDGKDPCWANDGRHIFFTHRVGGHDQLYLLDSVTKKISKLTSLGASDAAFYYPAK